MEYQRTFMIKQLKKLILSNSLVLEVVERVVMQMNIQDYTNSKNLGEKVIVKIRRNEMVNHT